MSEESKKHIDNAADTTLYLGALLIGAGFHAQWGWGAVGCTAAYLLLRALAQFSLALMADKRAQTP